MYIHNTSALSQSTAFILPNEHGMDTLYCLVQATYSIDQQGKCQLSETQQPIQEDNHYWKQPDNSSLRTPGVVHTAKAATDILVTGAACARHQHAVDSLTVSLQVQTLKKVLRIMGDRHWHNGKPSAPTPFTTMPITYENAFGGSDDSNGTRHDDPRNPVGKGYRVTPTVKALEGTALPNIEDPQHPIQHYRDQPSPAGFAPIAPHWQARTAYAGTYDDAWRRQRAPFAPEDYQPRCQNTAHPDLVYPGFLHGGESIRIHGMHPEGHLAFTLPNMALEGALHRDGQPPQTLDFVIDTLHLYPNTRRFTLTWRAEQGIQQSASLQHIRLSSPAIDEAPSVEYAQPMDRQQP